MNKERVRRLKSLLISSLAIKQNTSLCTLP